MIVIGVVAVLLVAGAIAAYLALRTTGDKLPTYGPSMEPTLVGRVDVEIDTDAYDDAPPEIGDIVVLQGPSDLYDAACGVNHPANSPCPVAGEDYARIRLLKRVIAGPGDTVAFDQLGYLIRNGKRMREDYINTCPGSCSLPRAITVPEGHYFVAGDNRPNSSDSRIWGSVPEDAFDGRVILDG